MTAEERVDIEDAISELLAWGQEDRYRRAACKIAVSALREKIRRCDLREASRARQMREGA